jgi:amino acid permease
MNQTQEKNQSLWLLTAAPVIWAAHFLLCYITASIWCAKVGGTGDSMQSVRVVIIIYTIIALASIGMIGWIGYRRHSYGSADLPHDDDTPADRHRFLGFATLLLAALSAVAVIYAALVVIFFKNCY